MASNKRTLDYNDASAIFLDMMDGESTLSDEEDSDIEVEEQAKTNFDMAKTVLPP